MALSKDTIERYADLCTPNTETGSLNYRAFARAIETEVRKDDEALILQLVEALDGVHPGEHQGGVDEAIAAGRARLEKAP